MTMITGWARAAALAASIGAASFTGLAAGEAAGDDPLAAAMTDAQKQRFDALVRQYILDHPEVIVESLQAYQTRQRAAEQRDAQAALVAMKGELENDPRMPIAGNPAGDVTVVEFFDYRCTYCKRVLPAIQELIESDGNIRYVFVEFPVLGPESVTAARAALAVWNLRPETYFAFHTALLEARGSLSEDRVLQIATGLGLDAAQLRTAMADPKIDEALERNYALGRRINVTGTPAFVIGGKLVPGAIDLAAMKQLVSAARDG
ncbi:MAG: DsbA family protein [Rhodospirillales bacterium]